MSVNSVWIDGFMQIYDPATGKLVTTKDKSGKTILRQSISQGSAVEASPGLFLTAGHVIAGPLSDPSSGTAQTYKALPLTSTYRVKAKIADSLTPYQRQIIGGNPISNVNLEGYTQDRGLSANPGSDFAAFQSTPMGTGTGIIAFNNPTAKQISDFFPNLSYTGYKTAPIVTGGTNPPIYNSNNQNLKSVDAYVNTGTSVIAGGPGTLQISGGSPGGTSGAGVIGTSQNTSNPNGNTYIVGTVQGDVGNGSATLVNYINNAKLWYLFKNYTPPSGVQIKDLPRNELVGNPNGNDSLVGVNAPENIIANGGGNKILAGSYGDIINPGNGLGNEVFLPSNDSGTTILITPGSTTIVGGTANDKLVVPLDRLWTKTAGTPSSSSATNSSSTVQLLGEFYNPTLPASVNNLRNGIPEWGGYSTYESVAGKEGSTDPMSWEIGNYDYQVGYHYDGKDLGIDFIAHDPSVQSFPTLWRTHITLVDYQPGEFGLSFTPASFPSPDWSAPDPMLGYWTANQNYIAGLMPAPQSQPGLNDDAANAWNYTSMQPITPPTQAKLNSDLQFLQNLYGNSGSVSAIMSTFSGNSASSTSLYASNVENRTEASSTATQASQLIAAMSSFGSTSSPDTIQSIAASPSPLALAADPTAPAQHRLAA